MPPGTGPPPGRRFHACFGHGDRLMVFDVWDSPEVLDAFTATLMPILALEHIDMAPPEPLEIDDLVDGGDSGRCERRSPNFAQGLLRSAQSRSSVRDSTASRGSRRRTTNPTELHESAMTRRPSIGPPGPWPSHRPSSARPAPTVPSQSARAEPTWHRCGRREPSPRSRSRSRWWSPNATCSDQHHPARRRRPTTPGRQRRRPNDHRADQRSERHAPPLARKTTAQLDTTHPRRRRNATTGRRRAALRPSDP